MRITSILFTAFLLVTASASAFAGNLTLQDGKAHWQSTNCTEPTAPESLLAVNKDTHASEMNTLMENYNAYATNMQYYMDCVSKEAEADSASINQAIAQSAKGSITAAQDKVMKMHDALQAKK